MDLCKRALYVCKRALYLCQRALYVCKRALYLCKRALYPCKVSPCLFEKKTSSWRPVLHAKDPTFVQKSRVYMQRRPVSLRANKRLRGDLCCTSYESYTLTFLFAYTRTQTHTCIHKYIHIYHMYYVYYMSVFVATCAVRHMSHTYLLSYLHTHIPKHIHAYINTYTYITRIMCIISASS